jgi:hypothetical protein
MEEFMRRSRVPKMAANIVLTLSSVDAMFIIRTILTKYGMGYLLSYIFWLSVL